MEQITTRQMRDALICAANLIVENEPYLTEIDTIIGDGDHGEGMKIGFSALRELLSATEYQTAYDLVRASGLELMRVMGGASGVIFGTMLIGGREAFRDKESLNGDDLIAYFHMGCDAIMKRGRAAAGDKTMLDALIPAVAAMEQRRTETADVAELLQAAAKGADEGAKASAQLLPRTGRSKNFREKGIGHPDPGAVSTALIFSGISQHISLI